MKAVGRFPSVVCNLSYVHDNQKNKIHVIKKNNEKKKLENYL